MISVITLCYAVIITYVDIEHEQWPLFTWHPEDLNIKLSYLRNKKGLLLGRMKRLWLEVSGLISSSNNVDGIVGLMLDATQSYKRPLTNECPLSHWLQRSLPYHCWKVAYRSSPM
jgi:hypothetical protein